MVVPPNSSIFKNWGADGDPLYRLIPISLSYRTRSLEAKFGSGLLTKFGASPATTIATVWPLPSPSLPR